MSSEYLQVAFMAGESLTEADIEEVYNNGMDTGGLDFSGADLSGDQPFFIADLLSSNKLISIVHLDLSHTVMKVDGFEAILFAATEVKSLESFVAKSLKLPKEAGMSLSKLLSSRGCLKVLDVSGNDLGDVGVSNLSGAFSIDHSKTLPKQLLSVVTITVLDLSGNDVGDAGVLALCRGLSQFVRRASAVGVVPFLKVLRLNNNQVTDKAAICIAQLINHRAQGSTTNGSEGSGLSPVPRGNNAPATLQLEELALDFNPLSARGICALLGSAKEGVHSPLKRLFLANTSISVEVIELLAENLLYYENSSLQYLNLAFSVQTVLQLILGQSAPANHQGNHHSLENAASPLHALCGALRKLASSLAQYTTARGNASALHIELGALHSTVFNYASHLQDAIEPVPNSGEQVQEIVRTLEALNRAEVARVLNLQVVPNVAQWVRSAEYVFDEHGAAYKAAEATAAVAARTAQQNVAPAAAPSPAAPVVKDRPAPQATTLFTPVKSSFLDTFKSNLDANKQLNISGILGNNGNGNNSGNSDSGLADSAVLPSAGTATARDSPAPAAPTEPDGSAGGLSSAGDNKGAGAAPARGTSNASASESRVFMSSLAHTLSSAEQEFRSLIRASSTAPPPPTQPSQAAPPPPAKAPSASECVQMNDRAVRDSPLPAVLEGEYRKLRADQTTAFHDLSNEIDKLAHLSPNTKASAPSLQQPPQGMVLPAPVIAESNPSAPGSRSSPFSATAPASAAAPAPSAEGKAEPSLVQIIGYMQAQIASMTQKQHLYETSFINKFSNLEYRIEAMEAALRLNNETLLAMQIGGGSAREADKQQSTEASPIVSAEPSAKTMSDESKPTTDGPSVPDRIMSAMVRPSPAAATSAIRSAGASDSNRSESSPLITGTQGISSHPSYRSPQTKSTPKSPGIPNELLITDLLARLEVVEGRMLQDRASALQSALNRQLHQERLQQRHDLLDILVENSMQGGSAGVSPANRRSPGSAQGFAFPDGSMPSVPAMTVSPYGLQATTAVPGMNYAPFSPPPQPLYPTMVPMPAMANQQGQQVYQQSPFNPYGTAPSQPQMQMQAQYYAVPVPQPQMFASSEQQAQYLPYPPAPSPYVPQEPHLRPQQGSVSPPQVPPYQQVQTPQAPPSPQTMQGKAPQDWPRRNAAPQYQQQGLYDELSYQQPRTADRPSPKREREPEPTLEPFQFNFNDGTEHRSSPPLSQSFKSANLTRAVNITFLTRSEADERHAQSFSDNRQEEEQQHRDAAPTCRDSYLNEERKGRTSEQPSVRHSVTFPSNHSSDRSAPSVSGDNGRIQAAPVSGSQQRQQGSGASTVSYSSSAPVPAQPLQARQSQQAAPVTGVGAGRSNTTTTGSVGPRARPTESSPYLDNGYYNYKFDTPLVRQPDDASVQSQASSASNNSWRQHPARSAEPRQKPGTDYRRLISHQQDKDNNANNMHHSINYSVINDISRNSLSMADDTLNDSISLLNTREDREVNNNNHHFTTNRRGGAPQSQPFHHNSHAHSQQTLKDQHHGQGQGHGQDMGQQGPNNAADSAGWGRSKTPNFMRPTSANAFKAATVRPSSTLR